MMNGQPDEGRDTQVQPRGPSVVEKVGAAMTKAIEPKPSVGIPFFWAFLFSAVLLASIFLGHYLTVQGQNLYLQRDQQRGGGQASYQQERDNQDLTKALQKLMEEKKVDTQRSSSNETDKEISEHLLSVSQSMTAISDKVAVNGRSFEQNLKTVRDNLEHLTNVLQDDTSKRDLMEKLELALSTKTPDITPLATDFRTLNAKIDQQVAAKNDVELLRKDLSGLSSKVQDLTALIRSREAVPGLGEEFSPKK